MGTFKLRAQSSLKHIDVHYIHPPCPWSTPPLMQPRGWASKKITPFFYTMYVSLNKSLHVSVMFRICIQFFEYIPLTTPLTIK